MFKIKWLVGHIVLDLGVMVTNICEQVLMAKRWTSLDSMDSLLLSLSISDLVCGIVFFVTDIWMLVLISSPQSDVSEKHMVADRIWDSFCLFSVFGSACHVITVAADRICAIRFPSKYYIFSNYKYKACMLTIIWVSTLISTVTVSIFSIHTNDSYFGLTTRGAALSAFTGVVFIMYFLVLCMYCQKKGRYTTNDFTNQDGGLQYKVLKPFTLISFLLGLNFIVCVSPITYSYYYPLVFHPIGDVMFTLKSILNPWIYFTKILFKSRYFNRIRPDTYLTSRDTTHTTLESRDTTNDNFTSSTARIMNDDLSRDDNDSERTVLV